MKRWLYRRPRSDEDTLINPFLIKTCHRHPSRLCVSGFESRSRWMYWRPASTAAHSLFCSRLLWIVRHSDSTAVSESKEQRIISAQHALSFGSDTASSYVTTSKVPKRPECWVSPERVRQPWLPCVCSVCHELLGNSSNGTENTASAQPKHGAQSGKCTMHNRSHSSI